MLTRIEKSEKFLIDLGFRLVRVRDHGTLARIEVDSSKRKEILDDENAGKIHQYFKSLGYKHITIDILGYKTGSFDSL